MNKYKNTIITLLAIGVLIAVGIHVSNTNKNRENNRDIDKGPMHVEVVKTEAGEEEIELDRPLSQSFSNALSNAETSTSSTSETNSVTYVAKKTFTNVIETIVKPFTLGFYYFDTINKHGIEKCIPTTSDSDEEEDFPEYNKDNFKLTNIEFKDRSVYLHVDADESPKKTCAKILQFKDFKNTLYDAVHVIVE